MSSERDDGGPAFPNVPEGAGDRWADWDKGMTLRDYFAAEAMKAIRADTVFAFRNDPDQVADLAYEQADAMLKARRV